MALDTVLGIPGVAPAEAGRAAGSVHYRHIHPVYVAPPAEAGSWSPVPAALEPAFTGAVKCTCAKHTGRFDYAGATSRWGMPAECGS